MDVSDMPNQQLCLGLVKGMSLPPIKQLHCIKNAGFDGFFALWQHLGQLDPLAEEATFLDLHFQSIHAPFRKAKDIWSPESCGDDALKELLDCLRDCDRLHVPIMVAHVYKGFDIEQPNKIGVARFGTLIEAAAARNIKIAFENVEGEEHLSLLLERFGHYDHVGFCWDSGHELCYNHCADMLAKYGDKLFATHLNDNLGVSNADGNISSIDDLHLLPFDGIANWDNIAKRLDRIGYSGPLTFELSVTSKPGRHENDQYNQMTIEQFFALAYTRAKQVAAKRGNYEISSNQ
jgi:sugar phosphate isomerase/epimerase